MTQANYRQKKKNIDYDIDEMCLRIVKLAFNVFKNRRGAFRFLMRRHSLLDGVSALKAIENGHADRVEKLLGEIEHSLPL